MGVSSKEIIEDDLFFFTLSDLKEEVKRRWKKIVFLGLLGSLCTLLFYINKPPNYTCYAIFKEQSSAPQPGGLHELKSLLAGGFLGDDSSAGMLFKSTAICEPVVRMLNLQASIIERTRNNFFMRARKNLLLEWQHYQYTYKKRPKGGLIDRSLITVDDKLSWNQKSKLVLQDLVYEERIFRNLTIHFLTDLEFIIKDDKDEIIAKGRIAETVKTPFFSFVLHASEISLKGAIFDLSLSPVSEVAKSISKWLTVKKDKDNKNFLFLNYTDTDPVRGSVILNAILESHKNYLKESADRLASKQLSYLEKRQKETTTKINHLIEVQAGFIKKSVEQGGFFEIKEQLKAVSKAQGELQGKLRRLSLILELLESDGPHPYFPTSSYPELKSLSKIQDQLSVYIQRKAKLNNQLLPNQDIKLKDIEFDLLTEQVKLENTIDYLNKLTKNNIDLPEPPASFFENQSPLAFWFKEMAGMQRTQVQKSFLQDYLQAKIEQGQALIAFLKNQKEVKANLFGDLTQLETKSLDAAIERCFSDLEKIEAHIGEYQFFQKQLGDPFSTLTGISVSEIEDPLMTDWLQQIAKINYQLKDHSNFSFKDLERLRQEQDLIKNILLRHVDEGLQILRLQADHLKERLNHLSQSLLKNIEHEIENMNSHLEREVQSHRGAVLKEKAALQAQLHRLQDEMISLPKRWTTSKELALQTEMYIAMIKELTAIIEAKNIAANIERTQSIPIERAQSLLVPNAPQLYLKSLLGFSLLSVFSCIFFIGRTILKGVPLSQQNLQVLCQPVAGPFKKPYFSLDPQNLPALRQAILYLLTDMNIPMMVATLGCPSTLVKQLAVLISKKEISILVINFLEPKEDSTFLSYLNRATLVPPSIEKKGLYDQILVGNADGYLPEMITGLTFKSLKAKWMQQYNLILLAMPYKPCDIEAFILSQECDRSLIYIQEERIPQMHNYFLLNKQQKLKSIFLMEA